jgi:nicotinate-nucleotide pyrophosphorylase
MFDNVTLKLNADPLIISALKEDITSEDVSTNSVMPEPKKGEVQLICKQDGIICGLPIFARVFTLLDENTVVDLKVRVGGGNNHRYNLTDGVLLKDNHIGAAGGVAKAVKMAKEYAPFVRKIEIEVENLDMVREAVEAGADIIMLDNMSHDTMKEALDIIDGRAEVEISGNITKENLEKLSGLSVDYVSSGALTHSAPIMDISLKNLHPIK